MITSRAVSDIISVILIIDYIGRNRKYDYSNNRSHTEQLTFTEKVKYNRSNGSEFHFRREITRNLFSPTRKRVIGHVTQPESEAPAGVYTHCQEGARSERRYEVILFLFYDAGIK